ncbi:hypothetical protein [Clavibacter michiganensis]|nr:hypothetical protein [Clavibacter michiganensis]
MNADQVLALATSVVQLATAVFTFLAGARAVKDSKRRRAVTRRRKRKAGR